jgi:hypothetical protein
MLQNDLLIGFWADNRRDKYDEAHITIVWNVSTIVWCTESGGWSQWFRYKFWYDVIKISTVWYFADLAL